MTFAYGQGNVEVPSGTKQVIDRDLYSAALPEQGWCPPTDLLEKIFGVAVQYAATINKGCTLHTEYGDVRYDYQNALSLPAAVLIAQTEPERVSELLSTLAWLGQGQLRGWVFSEADGGVLSARDLSVARRNIDQLVKKAKDKEDMALTRDAEQAARLIEEARETAGGFSNETRLEKLDAAMRLAEHTQAPVLYAVAASMKAGILQRMGKQPEALTIGRPAVKLLRDVGLELAASRLERDLSAPPLPLGYTSAPLGEYTREVKTLAGVPNNPHLLGVLKELRKIEVNTESMSWDEDCFLHSADSRHATRLSEIAGGDAQWNEIAQWLRAEHTVETLENEKLTVDLDRLEALISRVGNVREETTEVKERDTFMAEIKDKIVGAATDTGTGVVDAFKKGLAISGSQKMSDKIVGVIHAKLGHNIPMASSPIGQQIERVAFPALIHLVAGLMPDKVPGAALVQETCMLAITGVAKDDGDALIEALLPVFGEVLKMGTTDGFDLASMMSTTTVEQVMGALARDARLYNEYHALIVRLGKEYCRKTTPRCEQCPLRHIR